MQPDKRKGRHSAGQLQRCCSAYETCKKNAVGAQQFRAKNVNWPFKLHQFMTEQVGVAALRQHLWQVIGIGNASRDKIDFDRNFYRAFPQAIPKDTSGQYDLFEALEAAT